MRLKILLNTIFFFILFLLIALLLSCITTKDEYPEEKSRIHLLYTEPQNSIDVVFIGASSAYYSWNNIIVWKDYGIPSINMATFGVPLYPVKYFIKEILKTQKPKVIIINIDNLLLGLNTLEYLRMTTYSYIMGFKPSLNKYEMIHAINNLSEKYSGLKLNLLEKAEFYLPVIRFHHNWKKLYKYQKSEYCPNMYKTFLFGKTTSEIKGAVNSQTFFERQVKKDDGKDVTTLMSDGELIVLRDLFDFIKKIDVPVLLVNSPRADYFYNPEIYKMSQIKFSQIYKLADEYGIEYLDLQKEDKIRKLNITPKDCMDKMHLNYQGSLKYTNYLAPIIKEKYNLEDKRDNPQYSSWDEAYSKYSDMAKKYNINLEERQK